jgi:hypothetical protein
VSEWSTERRVEHLRVPIESRRDNAGWLASRRGDRTQREGTSVSHRTARVMWGFVSASRSIIIGARTQSTEHFGGKQVVVGV